MFPPNAKMLGQPVAGSLLSTEEVPLFRCRHKGVLASQDAFVLSALGVLHQFTKNRLETALRSHRYCSRDSSRYNELPFSFQSLCSGNPQDDIRRTNGG